MAERYGDLPTQIANPFRSKYEGLSLTELERLRASALASRSEFTEGSSLYEKTNHIIDVLDELIAEQSTVTPAQFIMNHLLGSTNERREGDFDHTTIISAIPSTMPRVSLIDTDAPIDDHLTVTPDALNEDVEYIPDSCKIVHHGEVIALRSVNFPQQEVWLAVLERSRQDAASVYTIEHSGALADRGERELLQRALAADKNPEILRQEEAAEQDRQAAIQAAQQQVISPLSTTVRQSSQRPQAEDTAAGRLLKGTGTPKSHHDSAPWKERLSIKLHPVRVLGSVAAVAALFIGGSTYNAFISHDGPKPAANADVNQPGINKDILQKINPDITAKDLKPAQCWDSPLLDGSVSGQAQVAMLFTANGVTNGLRMQDKDPKGNPIGAPHYLPISIDKTPVHVAVCAPEKLQAAIATMKDGVVTINRADLTPNLNLAAPLVDQDKATGRVPMQKFEAMPAQGLTADMAAAITKSLTVAQNRVDLATLAQAELATAITKDSTSVGRLSGALDARMQILIQKQINAFYEQQGRKSPTYQVVFTGNYPAPVAVDPTSLPDITKRTESKERIVSSQTVIGTFLLNVNTTMGGN